MRNVVFLVLTFFATLFVGCERPGPGSPQQTSSEPPTVAGLSHDEAAGGHVLQRHVGLSDSDLRRRLAEEPSISAASTYTDRQAAEKTVAATLAGNHERIGRWLDRSGRHPNLVLDYKSTEIIGRTLNRGETEPRSCSHALVVLKYDPPSSYHVLTSYPECRP